MIVNLAVAAVGYGTPRGRRRLLGVVALIALLRILSRWSHVEIADIGASLLSGALAVFAAFNALTFAVKGRKADAERLSAALSGYLLAGHFFGIAYFQVEQLRPGSFAVAGTPTHVAEAILGQLYLAILIARLVGQPAGSGDPQSGP